jgi:hypothetical protein
MSYSSEGIIPLIPNRKTLCYGYKYNNDRIKTDTVAFVKESERAYYSQVEKIAGEFWDLK